MSSPFPLPAYRAGVRYDEQIHEDEINFAARKTPTRQHFRIVECRGCGLIYSSPILPPEIIYRLYRKSPFIHEMQLGNMIRDYQDQLRRLMPQLPAKPRLLEIGCANGMFLEAAAGTWF